MASLFSRKVFKTGRSGLAIYLPAPWTRWNQIKQGDTVEVEAGRNLTVKVVQGKEREKKIKGK